MGELYLKQKNPTFLKYLQKETYMKSKSDYIGLLVHSEHFSLFPTNCVGQVEGSHIPSYQLI